MDLYYHPISPPCWTVLLLGRELDLSFNLLKAGLIPEDPLQKVYHKLNPQHTVPTLADGDFGLGESRSILRYLMAAYSGSDDHPLYPKDPKARAVVESRLDFDLGMLYASAYDFFSPQWESKSEGTDADRKKLCEALGVLEEILGGSRYAAGDRLTIADLSLVVSVSFVEVCGFELEKYPKIVAWYDVCKKEIKGYQEVVADRFELCRAYMKRMKQ
uniref:glutathione transferase n=1 Tax=Culex tarsalis TaxID=7177 RepID=A0A1Q3FRG7_CULTA